MTRKIRLDSLLVEKGEFESRQRAQASIMAGEVWVNGRQETKSGRMVSPDASIELRISRPPYVSRGGLKLAKALQAFDVQVAGKVALDIGASTGGFTDCLLQNGAAKVYAVDVGYGQLHWSLRQDPRVIVMERCNIRYVRKDDFPDPIDLCTVDVSFISLAKVVSPAIKLLAPAADIIALVKPQFEAGPEKVGKGGIVRDSAVYLEVLTNVYHSLSELGLLLQGVDVSPIRGGSGNVEFLEHWKHQEAPAPLLQHERDWQVRFREVIDGIQKSSRP